MKPTKNARTRAFFYRSVPYPLAPFLLRKWLIKSDRRRPGARGSFFAVFSVFVRSFSVRLRDREDLARLAHPLVCVSDRFVRGRKSFTRLAVPDRICFLPVFRRLLFTNPAFSTTDS